MVDIKKTGLRQGDLVDLVSELKDCVTRARVDIPLHSWRLAADYTVLTAATIPGVVINDNGPAIEWAATETAAILAQVKVPGDYDAVADSLTLNLQVLKEGATDNVTVGVAVYVSPEAGGGRGADLNPTDPTTGAAAFDGTDDPGLLTASLSGNSVVAGDTLTVVLTPGAHGTDAIELWASWLTYGKDCETLTIEGED